MKYSAIIVLANEMDVLGGLNDESSSRMDLAIEEYDKEQAPVIVTCGWNYREDTPIKIADAMKKYAIQNGNIPASNILTEINSRDTVGDAVFTKKNFATIKGWDKLLIITSDYHLHRTKKIFTFVYGNKYLIDVKGAFTNNSKSKEKNEKKSLAAFYETFKDTEEANDLLIRNRLCQKHPFYNGDIYTQVIL